MAEDLCLTRELVDRLPAAVPDPGEIAEVAALQTEAYFDSTLQAILNSRSKGQALWVFAIGSLIWNPCFDFAEKRPARIRGWHRSFCMGPDTRYRGNPVDPGLMLSLDRGGQCRGAVFRLSEARIEKDLRELLRREPPMPPSWVTASTPKGPVRAIAFTLKRGGIGYVGGMTDVQVAAQLARAVGMLGSMPDYPLNSINHLRDMGIHDSYLWRMQKLVAHELAKLDPH